jgi:hypothetical protein
MDSGREYRIVISRETVLHSVGVDTPLGMMIGYSDDRYDLIRGLCMVVGDSRITATPPNANAWAELCHEAMTAVETSANRVGRLDEEVEARGTYMATVLNAHRAAMQRLSDPKHLTAEVRCGGEIRHVILGRRMGHGQRCPCLLFEETISLLDLASTGLSPWAAYAGEDLVWLGMRGLTGMHVIRLHRGKPSALEGSVTAGEGRYRLGWGYKRGTGR